MRVLVIDDIHPLFINQLTAAGFEVDYVPNISADQVAGLLPAYEGLVVRSKLFVSQALMESAKNLRFIARAGAGMDNIDDAFAEAKGIHLINAPEGNRNAVAEHLVGMLLSLLNRMPSGHQEIQSGMWQREENRGVELRGKTVGLIGFGNNGSAMARCLSGFGVDILAYDKFKSGFGTTQVKEASLEEIFKQADVLSLHIPLTKESKNWANQAFFDRFEKPIYFLNGARGEIVDMPALCKALDEGRVLAAGLDVLPVERFPALAAQNWFQELKSRPNVLFTPHVAGWTVESYVQIAEVLGAKIIQAFAKQ